MTPGLILDAALAVLLIATIAYCGLLYRRLNALRGSTAEMSRALAAFADASNKAQAELTVIKITGDKTSTALQERIETARALNDELRIVTESGTRLAQRLEEGLVAPRAVAPAQYEGVDQPSSHAHIGCGERSAAERELEAALRRAR